MFQPIAGDGNQERFALVLGPDGIYRVDGRAIPVSDDPAFGVDHCEPGHCQIKQMSMSSSAQFLDFSLILAAMN